MRPDVRPEMVARNAIDFLETVRKHMSRAIVRTQSALAENEDDGQVNMATLKRLADSLRIGLHNLDCASNELENLAPTETQTKKDPDSPPPLPPDGIDFKEAAAKIKARRNEERRRSP